MEPADPLSTAATLLLANVDLNAELAAAAGAYLARWKERRRGLRERAREQRSGQTFLPGV